MADFNTRICNLEDTLTQLEERTNQSFTNIGETLEELNKKISG